MRLSETTRFFIEDEFKNVDEKADKERRYKVIVRKVNEFIDIIEDAVDVCFNNSVLSVSTPSYIRYYKTKNLISWDVERLNNDGDSTS